MVTKESSAAALLPLSMIVLIGCAAVTRGPVRQRDLVDGVYRASHTQFPNRAVVEVTVRDQAVADIRVVSHFAYKGKKAEVPIVERMIAAQSTEVDAVTGATNSSLCITKAVQRAIEKAYPK